VRKFLLLPLLALLAGTAFAQEVDKVRLRQASHLPTFALLAGVGFNSEEGLVLMGDSRDFPAEIAALEKALKGDDSDAERYYRLGRLYDKIKDKKAEAAANKAVELYRRQLQARLDDGRLLADLGRALDAAGKGDEADATLTRATQVAPKEWSPWTARGHFLTGRALGPVVGRCCDLMGLLQVIATRQVAPGDLARAQRDFDEGMRCLGVAAQLAPREPEVWCERGLARFIYGFFQAGLHLMEGKRVNPMTVVLSDECLADLRQLARLRPDDPRAVGILAMAELLAFMARNPDQAKSVEHVADALPDETRKSVQENIKRLEQIAKGPDTEAAARAEEIQAMLSLVAFQDKAGIETHLRRALALSPKRDQSWDFLDGILATTDRPRECLALCLDRLKHKDNAHNRFLAAKACEYLKDYGKAEEQVRRGLEQEPEDLYCSLSLAALLLRKADDASVAGAGKELDRFEKLLKPSSPETLRDDYLVIRSIFLALTGNPAKAREMLAGVLQRDKDNTKAGEVRAALGNAKERKRPGAGDEGR
jgi:tetratricopeptide (TPR) repeat protein